MGRYAVVDKSGNVTNVIVWDGKTAYTPPEGTELVEVKESAGPGWTYKDGEFVAPVEETQKEDQDEEEGDEQGGEDVDAEVEEEEDKEKGEYKE